MKISRYSAQFSVFSAGFAMASRIDCFSSECLHLRLVQIDGQCAGQRKNAEGNARE
jgi:hypothetical protein